MQTGKIVLLAAFGLAASAVEAQEAVVIEPSRPASRVTVLVEPEDEPETREPIDAVLIVQNHASDDFQKPLSNIGDELSAALSGALFNVIDPNDAIGEEQNRGPWGENMPLSAATRLAENLDAQALLTAAVGETSVVGFGAPAKVQAVRMKLTLSAKRLPKGATVAAVTVVETSEKMTPEQLAQNAESVYAGLVSSLVEKAAAEFLAKCEKVAWKEVVPRIVEVAFGCNFPGADVSIDGVSYGTAGTIGEPPLKVKVSDGIHNLRISYPFTVPYDVRAKLQEGTTFIAVLRLNEEGRRIRKEDEYFDTLMDRIEKSGATDDAVRLLRARGYAKYLSSSYTRIHGMPQVLSMRDCDMPDFGLDPDKDGDGVETTTDELLDKAGAAAGADVPFREDLPPTANAGNSVEGTRATHSETERREPPDNTDIGVAMPLTQPQQAAPAPQTAPAPQPQNETLQNLRDIREGVDTGKDIIQGIKDIGDLL